MTERHKEHNELLHVFAKRSRPLYSDDLLASSTMSLVPKSAVIPLEAVSSTVGDIHTWELTELGT